jgi:hypothetical protein
LPLPARQSRAAFSAVGVAAIGHLVDEGGATGSVIVVEGRSGHGTKTAPLLKARGK